MRKEQLELLSAPPETLGFLRAVMKDPQNPVDTVAKKHALRMERDPRAVRSLKLNIMASYLLTPASLSDVGRAYGLSRQRVEQICVQSIRDLWKQSSSKLQSKFPDYPKATKEKGAFTHKQFRIAAALSAGEEPEELKGLSPKARSIWRTKMRNFGIEVPRKLRDLRKFAQRMASLTDDMEIEKALREIDITVYNNWRLKGESPVLPVREAAEGFVYYLRNPKLFIASLRRARIPVVKLAGGSGYYYIIAQQHRARAREVFTNDPRLKEFTLARVQQVAGPKADSIPSTYELQKRHGFESLGALLREMGVKFGRSGLTMRDFVHKGSPVAVFRYEIKRGQKFYFPTEKKALLRRFLKRSMKKG